MTLKLDDDCFVLNNDRLPHHEALSRRACVFTQRKKLGRREFWRAKLTKSDGGQLQVVKFPRDGSGLIPSLRESDGLVEVPEDVDEVRAGEMVNFIPFSGFGLLSQ
jgi:molybdopterin biosynthesis enzyme